MAEAKRTGGDERKRRLTRWAIALGFIVLIGIYALYNKAVLFMENRETTIRTETQHAPQDERKIPPSDKVPINTTDWDHAFAIRVPKGYEIYCETLSDDVGAELMVNDNQSRIFHMNPPNWGDSHVPGGDTIRLLKVRVWTGTSSHPSGKFYYEIYPIGTKPRGPQA